MEDFSAFPSVAPAAAPAAANTAAPPADNFSAFPAVGAPSGTPPGPAAPAPAYQPSAVPWLDGVNAFANSAVNAIPVVGPTLTNWGHSIDAGFNNMLGFPTQTPMDRASIDQAEQRQFPVASTAGTVAGTVAPFVLAGGVIPGAARVLGMEGGLASRVGFGSLSGGTINAADTAARGGSPDQVVNNFAIGMGVGGAAPLVGKAAGAVWNALRGQPVLSSAVQTVANAMMRDRIAPGTLSQRLAALGPDAVLADLGPNLRRQAGALASLPGEGQSIVTEALMARNAGRNSRIQGSINDTLGPAPIPSRIEADLASQRDALGPQYTQALVGAHAVDTQPIADNLDSLTANLRGDAQKAVQKVRGMLDIPGNPGNLDPYPGALLQTRHAIDDMMAKATPGTNEWRQLNGVRQQVDGVLTDAVPDIKAVDARYAELARQSGALTQGQQLLDSGRTAIRPAELADMLGRGALPQGQMVGPSAVPMRLAQGARAEIDRIVGTTANDLNGLKTALKGDGSWNRDRLAQLYGQGPADKLLGLLDQEQTYNETFNTVLRNSETAARTVAQQEMSPVVGLPTSTTFTGLAANALTKGAAAGLAMNKGNTNARIAMALMQRAPDVAPQYQSIVDALIQRAKRPALLGPAAVPLLEQRSTGQ